MSIFSLGRYCQGVLGGCFDFCFKKLMFEEVAVSPECSFPYAYGCSGSSSLLAGQAFSSYSECGLLLTAACGFLVAATAPAVECVL